MIKMIDDLRFAIRALVKNPGFTIVAVLTLAVGIGATTAIFSLFDAVLLKSLPVSNADQLFTVNAGQYPAYQAVRKETGIFSDVLAANSSVEQLDVAIDGSASEKVGVSLVSASYFTTLGVSAAVGRVFDEGDEQRPGEPAIAVVSYGYWQQRLARDAGVVGRRIRVSGTGFTVAGVVRDGFFGEEVGAAPSIWVPLTMWGQIVPGRNLLESPATAWLRTIGRLKPEVTVAQAEARLTPVLQRQLEEIFGPDISPDTRREIDTFRARLTPAAKGTSRLRSRFTRPLELLLAAVVLVLLISCANVANLSLARATSRRREVDLQMALGITRARLVRQSLFESLVLSALGGTIGLAIAWAGREALLRLISGDGTRVPLAVHTDLRVLLFAAGVSMASAVLSGSAPAWQSARGSLVSSLTTRHAIADRRSQRLGPMLVVAQVAVSLVLLMGAGLFVRTVTNLRDVDLGYATERLVILDVNPRAAGYSIEQSPAVTQRILDRLQAVRGITSASFAENGVMLGRDSSTNLIRSDGFIAGAGGFPRAQWDVVGPRYFSTLGISLVAGRDFSERDDERSPRVVAINEAMARQFFAGANPVGRRLVWGDTKQIDFEVIGVVRDVKQSGPREPLQLRFYLPYGQLSKTRPSWDLASVRFLVRTAADPTAMSRALERAIAAENPRLSVDDVTVGPDLVERVLVQERMIATLSIAFSFLGVDLACIGLYGLIAYHVAQRTSEIGVRMALGAQQSQVLWATLRRSLAWTAGGIACGLPLALSVMRVAESLLFGLSATDPLTLGGSAMVMVASGFVAAWIPARRASLVDPIVALRDG
jgi:predicted permease